ncbi:MAG: PorV/PorQ family protein [Candidatus Krumholzibacteriia bacterium]|nr:PorV/PorQ family protein [bacterium]MCB9513281.1 PorV/PorQ family protein [Candidatus Latescibacterota bacterium]MCB9514742.1 PorV/PorQ family protein [Candidatus Latescibacterota bacterium]
MKRTALLALTLVLFAQGAQAQIFEKVGTFGGQFLKIGPTARAAGMGNGFVAVADDASATYWNPGGLVDVPRTALHLDHVEWPADIKLDFVSYVFHTPYLPGVLGLTARALTMDPQVERTIYLPNGTGREFDAGDMSFGITYAQYFTERFSTGFTAHFIHMGLADKSVNTSAFDFGLVYRIGIRGMRLGMVVQNAGGEVDYDSQPAKLPIMFKVGLSAEAFDVGPHHMTSVIEFSHPPDNKERANLGVEYGFNRFFFLRSGYNAGYDANGLTGGFGLEIGTSERSRLLVDYAFEDLSYLGGAHRFSVSFAY